MLPITIPAVEGFDYKTEEFIDFKGATLQLEHSLVSISKWESKWCKSFLSGKEKTFEETIDYVRCMTITQNVDPNAYRFLTRSNIEQINDYISAPMTATYFRKQHETKAGRELVTAELIYYWMISLGIPIEPCQKWHLNRLLTLIKVCSIKNSPPKKMSKRAIMQQNAAINEARRKQLNSKG